MTRVLRKLQMSGAQLTILAAVVIVVALCINAMRVIADIRFRELKASLQNVGGERSTGASLSLITRYQFVQNRYNQGGEKTSDYLVEGELMAAASFQITQPENAEQKVGLFERAVVAVMNFAGRFTNTKPIADQSEDQGQKILEVAFFFERRREFAKAIEAYNASLKNFAQRKDMLAYIFLHRGFCYSNIGKRAEALADYRQAKAYDPGQGEFGTTAEVLALFLLDINKRLALVEQMSDSIEKGELLYLLMSYHRAIDTLNNAIARKPEQKAYFFRGRSLEETGNTAGAIADYRKTIALGRQSEWSAKANRRLYILGTYYEADAKLSQESQDLARSVGDEKFIRENQTYAQTVDSEKIAHFGDNKIFSETLQIIEERKQDDTGTIKLIDPDSKKEIAWTEDSLSRKHGRLDGMIERAGSAQRSVRLRSILLNPKTSRKGRREILQRNFRTLTRVDAVDGNEFVGIIDAEDEQNLDLITVMGLIKLPKNSIRAKNEIDSEKAFQ